jgi:succinate dehydrogenase / fumarate reductase, iron-sulfur subunit
LGHTSLILGADPDEVNTAMPNTVRFKIKRQDGPKATAYWEEFDIRDRPALNVIIALMDIQKNPVTASGQKTTPVAWSSNCLEEVCGACTVNINGKVRQACSALVGHLEKPVVLEPMTKFPVIRDLHVDRSHMFEALKRVKAWIPIDGTYALGPGPRMSQEDQEEAYRYQRCMTCGCCLEACPQVNSLTGFVGAAAIAQALLYNTHPTGKMHQSERLQALMGEGGIADCGSAQNCVRVCPKEIPLTRAIATVNRQLVKEALKSWLAK